MAKSEHFPEYYDELIECGSVTRIAEHQWRIYEMDGERKVYIVKVATIDQDDSEEAYADSISYQEYAEWLWQTDYNTPQARQNWLQEYNQYLDSKYGTNAVRVTAFQAASFDDQDYLFESAAKHPSEADSLKCFLADAHDKWQTTWTLLDVGEDAETEVDEVYEYWAIDSYLKSELESVGEKCVELFDLTVWCRTCTGQSFYYDYCMQTLGRKYAEERLANVN